MQKVLADNTVWQRVKLFRQLGVARDLALVSWSCEGCRQLQSLLHGWIQKGVGRQLGQDPLESYKLQYGSIEIKVRNPSRSNWTFWVQLLLAGGPYGPF